MRAVARPPASPALAFFAPRDVADVTAALAWADREATPVDDYDGYSDAPAWLLARLPAPRLHPRAHILFAAAAGVAPSALRAVLDGAAYIADDGVLRLWPWYPEEDPDERPRAVLRAAQLQLALPDAHLDDPYEPAHYLRRAGMSAARPWLAARGVDVAVAMIDRVPLPTQRVFIDQRYEGGMRSRSTAVQAAGAVRHAIDLFQYAADASLETRQYLETRLEAALSRLCSAVAGHPPPPPAPTPASIEAPIPGTQPAPGRVCALFNLRSGPLLVCDGAFIALDPAGKFTGAWPIAMGQVFARGDLAIINTTTVLDITAGRYLDPGGDLAPILARMGLAELPTTGGHDERTTPALSACGRYVLDVDESPYIKRLADGVVVADGRALERVLDAGARARSLPALLDPAALDVAPATILDGVRFVVRAGPSPARDGRSLAFALAGDRWRFLVGDAIWDRDRRIARLGATIVGGAFSDDGAALWTLATDHAIHLDLTATPRVTAIVPLAPLLAAAARTLAQVPHA